MKPFTLPISRVASLCSGRRRRGLAAFALSLATVLGGALASGVPDPLDACNVIWTTPSTNSSGSMPLGNGDLGLNLWVEPDGDLLFYLSKTDAWDEHCRLVKLGRIRVKLNPNPFRAGPPFRQELKLRPGEIEIRAGAMESAVAVRVWVDANHPVVRLEADGAKPFDVQAHLEVWRTQKRELSSQEMHGVEGFAKDQPAIAYPDTILDSPKEQLVWFHRNESSIWPVTLKHQGLETLLGQGADPLLHRTFGAAMKGDGLVKSGAQSLKSAAPRQHFALMLHALTAQTETADAWLNQLEQGVAKTEAVDWDQARRAHTEWWSAFWDRSWIRVTAAKSDTFVGRKMIRNELPLRIGADSEGQNRFHGGMTRLTVWNRALSAGEIRRRAVIDRPDAPGAETMQPTPVAAAGLVAEWDWVRIHSTGFYSAGPQNLFARKVDDVEQWAMTDGSARRLLHFHGRGYLEVPHQAELDLEDAVTLEAWICPDALPAGGGRIMDKSQAGTSNGYLLDTYPGHSLRLIVADGALAYDAKLPTNRWSHVAGVFDARTGEKELYLNGSLVASTGEPATTEPIHQVVTRGYTLQRFLNACAGRGAFPIKFNGSIFNVDVPGKFDADYRQWGGCYWFQNTRLPYWPMLASGDLDLMAPLFRMYRDALPLAEARTKLYYQHGGAFFPETIYFWGTYANSEFGYGWDRADLPPGLTVNQYIRYYWTSGLELTAMMLDRYAFAPDERFLEETLVPLAAPMIEFFDQHWPRDGAGKVRFEPSQALETWWECVNPMPEVAGLRFVLDGLLALPESATTESQRAAWRRLLSELPAIPTREPNPRTEVPRAGAPAPLGTSVFGLNGAAVLAAAEKFATQRNMENAELYAVFPYRLYGVGKPDLELARRTFAVRQFKGNRGWQQDETQAALLGLADEAGRMLAGRFATKNPESRFPAFWGPNFDWIPDQDHGANGLMALQTMLLQWDGRKMLLFPAWPKDWDVEFKLHAPLGTTVEGVYREGKLEKLEVTPEARTNDLIILKSE